MAPRLASTRYTEIGTYIGQFFIPGSGALANDVRVPCLVGKGDRLFIVRNTEMRRSFRFDEQLAFSTISPFLATLDYLSNGSQTLPVRLRTQDGVEVTNNKWSFVQGIGGVYDRILIQDTAYDPSAQYYLDYQTTSRSLADPIPEVTIGQLNISAQVREIVAVGPFQDQQEYAEYVDFFVESEIDTVVPDPDNINLTNSLSTVNSAGASGTGTVVVSTSASYSHPYNRVYRLECIAASGVSPTRLATLAWNATPVSFGENALPPTPISVAITKPQISLDESNLLTLNNQPLELGVIADFDFGASNYNVGDVFYLQANGAGLIELDSLLSNTNQFTEFSDIDDNLALGSTGSLTIDSLPSAYTQTEYNTKFRVQCLTVSGGLGSRVASFAWVMYGNSAASGSFTVSELVPNSDLQVLGASGITVKMSFGATHYVVGDMFDWVVSAPQRFYKGKESVRNIKLQIGGVTQLANQALYSGGYNSDTPEGRFGTWTADTNVNHGRFEIPDGLRFYVRNAYTSTLVNAGPGGSMIVAGDTFDTQARSLGLLNFSLQKEVTETFTNPADIQTDVTGAITGYVGAKYVSLANQPDTVFAFRRVSNGSPLTYSQVVGTQFFRITTPGFGVSDGDVQVVYRWHGAEPDPGQSYFLTAKYLRPVEMYDRPFLFLTAEDARRFLAPSTIRNDLYIGAQIAFDYAIPGLFCVQVRDSDDDGVYSKDDYRRGITSFLEDKRATELVVLNSFQNIGDQLNTVNRANEPFETHECLTFVGCPIGTPIGSENEAGSLAFYSRRLFAVYGQSPAHGTRILVGHTKATRTITLEDNSASTVTLDGSFIAAALASLVASFTDPKETVLLKQITSFDSVETYKREENLQLGGNNIIYFKDVGQGVMQIMEDITTDPFSPDTLNLNQMTQKQFVTKDIRRVMTGAIIGQVFPSAASGVALIQDVLMNRLKTLVTRSLIADYQTATGSGRQITNADVQVARDNADPTLYYIGYNYFLATVAKRIYGLFTVSLPGGFPK